ncbi:hypothetical protein Pint_09839 [Pistacia integerrima]|uniref:Uncharacterized protein n=1 Tax=Pistacia integerrima TaxID=434235 RepID=A0ACC0XHT2_9ROSI|nr:hypothetical protein Pint_09839 [Pistacia integerrima]
MNNLERQEEGCARDHNANINDEGMAASSAATDGVAAVALRSVIQRVHQAAERSGRGPDRIRIRRELVEKAPQLPEDIEWHFIGNLQSNKVKALLTGVPNLAMVETVDDKKIADRLDRVVASMERKPLKVFIQVNTSGEESKSGVEPSGCVELAQHVSQSCPNLEFSGLMTIGMLDYTSTPENFKVIA